MSATHLSLGVFFFMATVLLRIGAAWAVPATGELGSDCTADAGVCNTGLFCRDGYCCDKDCVNGCQACNGEDVWGQAGANGYCLTVRKYFADPDCGAYLCDGNSSFCQVNCMNDDVWCTKEFYCGPNNRCVARKSPSAPCTTNHECLKGYCAKSIVDGGEAATGTCCDQPCNEGTCKGCLRELTGKDDGICDNVLSQEQQGPPLRCAMDTMNPCGNTGYCDGKGACALHAQGPISSTCSADAGATLSVAQVCNGEGGCTCAAVLCGPEERCVENAGCIQNDGGSAVDASPSPDASLDSDGTQQPEATNGNEPSEGADTNRPEADGAPDSGTKECKNLGDCIAPEICHKDSLSAKGRCGPGRPGERCWPLQGDAGVFDPDGNCVPGVPLDPPEVIGACSMAAHGGRRMGWLTIVGILVSCLSRRAQRRSPTAIARKRKHKPSSESHVS